MARHVQVLAAVALVMLTGPNARATVLVPADLSELSRDAAVIIRGTVIAVRTEWADGRRRVETLVSVSVRQVLKGDPGRTIVFKVPGGDMGRYRSVTIGAPSFREGDDVFLFLGARPPAMPYLLGFGQGVYRVTRDAGSGVARVLPPALVASRTSTGTVRRGDPARRPPTTDEFAEQVRAAMKDAGTRDDTPRGPRPAR